MNFHPLSTAEGPELAPRAGDADAVIHVPASASFYEAAIEGLSLLDEQILTEAPDFPRLYESGVIYRKEARDTWRHADDVLCSGGGDCEDLAAWRVAELRVSGDDPDAYVYVYQSGPHRYHAVVARGSGRIEDPSLILGMQVSAERRKNMPKFVGQGEGNYPATGRPFGVCPRAAAAENRLETVGDASSPLIGPADEGHTCSAACPHFAERWKNAVRAAVNGEGDGGVGWGFSSITHALDPRRALSMANPLNIARQAAGQAGRFFPHQAAPQPVQADYYPPEYQDGQDQAAAGDDGDDQGYDPSQDQGYDPNQDQGYDPNQDPNQDPNAQPNQDQGPRGPSRAQRFGSALYQPVKYAGTALNYAAQPLVYGARLGTQVLKTGADVARGATKLVSLPLKGLSKVFSILGEEVEAGGLPEMSHNLLGVEEDEEYEPGDEEVVMHHDLFSVPEYLDDADDDDFYDVARLAPESQRMRFETAEVAPGVWGGVVRIPRVDEPGKMLTMYTSPAPSEMLAAERLRNLATQAAHNPGLQLAVSPAALITMAAIRAGSGGKIGNALKAIGRFVQIQG